MASFGPTQVPLQNNGRKRGVGRINNVTFDPNNDDILWVGSPSGGLWKSIDGGQNWTSNTDLLPNLGVSDIAIDPSNTNIMYIITGDRDSDDTYAYGSDEIHRWWKVGILQDYHLILIVLTEAIEY